MDTAAIKPKKFVLPRFYVRNSRAADAVSEIADELTVDAWAMEALPSTSTSALENHADCHKEDVSSPSPVAKKEKTKEPKTKDTEAKTKPTKVKAPSAYNVFIKETCDTLTKTHANLTPRERYALAIQMWNERKAKNG